MRGYPRKRSVKGGTTVASTQPYSHLFSPWQIRHTRIANRVIFGPVCPTWVRSAHEGVFTEQAVAYYEERAKTGIGMIILGGHLVDKDTLYTPAAFPGLWNEEQVEGLARVARAVKKHNCAIIAQLLHIGLRSPTPFLKTDPARDPTNTIPTCSGRARCRLARCRAVRRRRRLRSTRSNTCWSALRKLAGGRSRRVSTASSCTSATAICRGNFCRRSTISGTTGGADRTRTGCGLRSSA